MSRKSDEDIINRDLVLYALYELGGAERPVHTEDVAATVFEYPTGRQRYRWERYANFPDKERVARELRRLKNLKGASLVRGHVNVGAKANRQDGWMLTTAGVDRIKIIQNKVTSVIGEPAGDHHIYDETSLRSKIEKTKCYQSYLEDNSLSLAKDHEFTDMLYCLPDASIDQIHQSFDMLLVRTEAVNAKDLLDFLEIARDRFSHLLLSKGD